jgi:HK97 family phage major capsid protein
MTLFTTNDGKSILRPEQVAALVVQPLIARAVATQVAQVIQVTNNVLRVPIVVTDPIADWTEEGAEINVSDQNLQELSIRPKKLAALSVISNELANDSSPAALQVVGDGIVRDLARKLDQAMFGSPASAEAPGGLVALSGVSEVVVGDTTVSASVPVVDGASAESLDWATLAQSRAELCNTKVDAFVTSPGRAAWLSFQKESQISNRGLLQPDPTSPTGRVIAGVPLYVTPACDDDTVWAIPRAHAIAAMRQDASVVADTSAFFTSDRTALRATLRIGYGFTFPESIVKISFQRPLLVGP